MTFGSATVDWQQGNIDLPLSQYLLHTVVRDGVAAVIHGPRAKLGHVADELMAAEVILGQVLVRSRHGVQLEWAKRNRLPGVDGLELVGIHAQPLGGECAVGRRNEQFHLGIGLDKGGQRLAIEVVSMVVARGGEVDEVQRVRRNDQPGHARVWLVGGGVLARERVGEVRVEQQVPAAPLDKKAALAKPPNMQVIL